MYNGGYALIHGEFCYGSRSGEICDHGLPGSIEGAILLLMGIIMIAIPLPSSRKKTIILSLLGFLCWIGMMYPLWIRYSI